MIIRNQLTTSVCRHCRQSARQIISRSRRQHFTSSYILSAAASFGPPRSFAPPPHPPPSGAAPLTNRRLISVHGLDAAHFLQGLVTANITSTLPGGLYSAFLNAQGRVLNDVFIYNNSQSKASSQSLASPLSSTSATPTTNAPEPQQPQSYLVEVDASSADSLLAHLKRHKLRAKLRLRLLPDQEYSVWSVWREHEPWTPLKLAGDERGIYALDNRALRMGWRVVLNSPALDDRPVDQLSVAEQLRRRKRRRPAVVESGEVPEVSLAAYTVRRMLKGVAEGQKEIVSGGALPMEVNLDFMGGVDFRKGCYVGQELTIRTHHTGVVRKRVLPVQLFHEDDVSGDGSRGLREEHEPKDGETQGDAKEAVLEYDPKAGDLAGIFPEAGAEIMKIQGKNPRVRPTGKWLGGVGNIGLALCRLDFMTDLPIAGSGGDSVDRSKEYWQIVKKASAENERLAVMLKPVVPAWIRGKFAVKGVNRTLKVGETQTVENGS